MSALPPGVESLLRRTAPRLAPEHLRRIGKALDPLPAWSAAALRRAQESVHAPVSRRFAAEMCEAWRTECPEMPGATLSALLCVAAGVAEDMEGRTAVEMVWTGPPTQSVPPRLTATVLEELIRSSRTTLHILTFATYRVPSVLKELEAAAGRGVAITMVAETADESGGKLTSDVLDLYRGIPGLELYVWPKEKRPAVGHGVAAMHAKAAVADSARALVSSANLTGSALESNIELGVLVQQGDFPARLVRHLTDLIVNGTLRRLE